MENAMAVRAADEGPTLMGRIGTALVGVLFVVSGVMKVFRFTAMAGVLAGKGIWAADIVLALVVAIEILCGAALIVLPQPRTPAAVLALFVVAATFLFHPFWQADAASMPNQLNHFLKNGAIRGALLTIAFAASRPFRSNPRRHS
jgi:putative oxidoreductase